MLGGGGVSAVEMPLREGGNTGGALREVWHAQAAYPHHPKPVAVRASEVLEKQKYVGPPYNLPDVQMWVCFSNYIT